jgi:hypothetical protein
LFRVLANGRAGDTCHRISDESFQVRPPDVLVLEQYNESSLAARAGSNVSGRFNTPAICSEEPL